MPDPFVVIGGDPAGLSAASKTKREAPEWEVIVFEKGEWVSYAQCGMPYYVKGTIDNLTDLLSLTPEAVADRDIDLRRKHEVLAVDPNSQTVTVEHEGSQFEQPYGDLLIATGTHAVSDLIPGSDLEGAFTMHSMGSAAALRASLTDRGHRYRHVRYRLRRQRPRRPLRVADPAIHSGDRRWWLRGRRDGRSVPRARP